mgnify:CR=1 FL=1
MKKLNEDFKSGKFEQVYLLYGEEGYLKKQYKKRFIKAMIPEGDTMNYAHYEGKNIPVKDWQIISKRCRRQPILFL